MNPRWIFVVVLTAAMLVRGGWGYSRLADLQADPDAYRALATSLETEGTLGVARNPDGRLVPSAYRPPLYPWLLSLSPGEGTAPVAVWLLHTVLGIWTCGLTFAIARRLIGVNTEQTDAPESTVFATDRRAGQDDYLAAVAGLGVAVDPILLRQSSLVMTETLATWLAVLVWWLWLVYLNRPWARNAAGLGCLLGLSILCRPAAAVWVAAWLAGWAAVAAGRFGWSGRHGRNVAVAATAAVAIWGVWIVRNAVSSGHVVALTTHGGYTLLLANNPLVDAGVQAGEGRKWAEEQFHRVWSTRRVADLRQWGYWFTKDLPPPQPLSVVGIEQEIAEDQAANEIAKTWIAERSSRFVALTFHRIAWLWAWWPSGQGGRLQTAAIGLWYGALFVVWSAVAVIYHSRLLRTQSRPAIFRELFRCWPAITLVLSLTAIHAVYWSNMRMRAPVMPAVYVSLLVMLPAVGRKRRPSMVRELLAN